MYATCMVVRLYSYWPTEKIGMRKNGVTHTKQLFKIALILSSIVIIQASYLIRNGKMRLPGPLVAPNVILAVPGKGGIHL